MCKHLASACGDISPTGVEGRVQSDAKVVDRRTRFRRGMPRHRNAARGWEGGGGGGGGEGPLTFVGLKMHVAILCKDITRVVTNPVEYDLHFNIGSVDHAGSPVSRNRVAQPASWDARAPAHRCGTTCVCRRRGGERGRKRRPLHCQRLRVHPLHRRGGSSGRLYSGNNRPNRCRRGDAGRLVDRRSFTAPAPAPAALAARRLAAVATKFASVAECATATECAARFAAARVPRPHVHARRRGGLRSTNCGAVHRMARCALPDGRGEGRHSRRPKRHLHIRLCASSRNVPKLCGAPKPGEQWLVYLDNPHMPVPRSAAQAARVTARASDGFLYSARRSRCLRLVGSTGSGHGRWSGWSLFSEYS